MKRKPGYRKKRELTHKQKRFVENFVLCLNGTKASIRAGYPRASAAQVAYENLRKPQILEAVEHSLEVRRDKSNLDRDALIGELIIMAFARSSLLFRSLENWSRLPSGVRQRGPFSTVETRVVNYKQRLDRIISYWEKLSLQQSPSISGRAHTELAISMISDELPCRETT